MRSKYTMASEFTRGEYLILYCLDKSSNDSTGVSNLDTVKKAAKLAVYEAMMMNPKSHQVAATNLPDKFLGASPPPYLRKVMISRKIRVRGKF